jgi:hypothetical protein
MDFPSTPPGGFHEYTANTPNAHWWSGTLVPPGEGIAVGVRKPSDPDLPLSYTTLANYNVFSGGPEPFGWVAFGSPTPIKGVPVTGSATYNAEVGGSTLDRMGLIEGTATLQFNFGAGTLSGHFDPIYFYLGGMGESYALASYQFTSTVYSSGFFAGSLDSAVLPTDGFFEGRFTGPNAEELMASWVAPYKDPLTLTDGWMFGVWVGKK